jgi:hypothetical protein
MIRETVIQRLDFSRRRLDDLQALNNGDLAGARPEERQQLIQEFFFHLGGAIDFLLQYVNIALSLGIDSEHVDIAAVRSKLPVHDPIRTLIEQLHPPTRGKSLPTDPYSEEGAHFRIMLLRNFVCHQRNNPFNFWMSIGTGESGRGTNLFLDPQETSMRRASSHEVLNELASFLQLVTEKCNQVLDLCPINTNANH